MARSLYLCVIYGAFLCAGLVAPFALGLGYVWVDTFTPQSVAYSLLNEFPVSLVMAVATLVAYAVICSSLSCFISGSSAAIAATIGCMALMSRSCLVPMKRATTLFMIFSTSITLL